MTPVVEHIRTAFHDSGARSYRIVAIAVSSLIVLSIILLVVELNLAPPLSWLVTADRVILAIFAVEIALRIATYRPPTLDFFEYSIPGRWRAAILGRLRYCLFPLNLVDILTVLALFPALRGLRALRMLRLFRTRRWLHYSNPLEGLTRAFRENGILFGIAFTCLGAATLLGGLTIFVVERAANPDVTNVGDGLWWAIVTLTTVGFGDISPVTGLGRAVGSVLMVAGMFTLALFAGIVGHTLLRTVLSIREESFRMSSYLNHVVICGFDAGAHMLLDALLSELDPEKTHLVVFAPGDRPPDVPPSFTWVKGDPRKESELPKARLTHASTALVVGSRVQEPQAADALTIMTTFTIRAYLAKQHANRRRKEPLYIIAEILEPENVAHAARAGADEVIQTARLGFSLLSHAVAMPGTSQVMGRVVAAGANSLYLTPMPPDYPSPLAFHEVSRRFKQETGGLVIGVRNPVTDEEHVNPDSAFEVTGELQLLYLAEIPIEKSSPPV